MNKRYGVVWLLSFMSLPLTLRQMYLAFHGGGFHPDTPMVVLGLSLCLLPLPWIVPWALKPEIEAAQRAAREAIDAAHQAFEAARIAERKLARAISANRARRRRSARMRRAGGWCSPEAKAARWSLYGNLCWVCGAGAKQTDHVIALAAGGSNWPANMRPACAQCNARKGARDWRHIQACGLPKPGRLP